jgi:hypothetical protein
MRSRNFIIPKVPGPVNLPPIRSTASTKQRKIAKTPDNIVRFQDEIEGLPDNMDDQGDASHINEGGLGVERTNAMQLMRYESLEDEGIEEEDTIHDNRMQPVAGK